MVNRETIEAQMTRAAQSWVDAARVGNYDEALRLNDELTGYSNALDRLDAGNEWDALKGSPDHSHG
jgi:dihydrodipicolinate synthase/N-acetylneuraminate lyase